MVKRKPEEEEENEENEDLTLQDGQRHRVPLYMTAHFDESGQQLRLIADNSPTEAGQ